jgi:nitroreductase
VAVPPPPSSALGAAVEDALRAPSVHNTQPWRWRIGHGEIELHADWNRHLPITDPDRRDLLISCGAALHHLQVALAARGQAATVTHFPDPEDTGHLATVEIGPGSVDGTLTALHPALHRRRTDRRRFAQQPPGAVDVAALTGFGRRAGVVLVPVRDRSLDRLAGVLAEAARRQGSSPGYAAELQHWTHRYAAGHDGVPASNVAASTPALHGSMPMRGFGRAQPPQPLGEGTHRDGAVALLIATPGDDPLDALVAGQAASAVLLAATATGLATTPLSQGLEVESSRRELQYDVLRLPEFPQLVIRVGLPAPGAADLPPSPRRPLRSVLMPHSEQP